MPPTAEQLNELLALCWQLRELTGRSCAEIGRALLATNTIRAMQPDPKGRTTNAQVQAEIRLLKHWIEQAKSKAQVKG